MNLLYPKIAARHWWSMLALALLGAVIAGLYGIIHDQITYTISPEYFTKLKFYQFHVAASGWPIRWRVAEVGFLATWWVGLFAGWFLARIAVPAWPPREARRLTLHGFAIMFAFVAAAGLVGGLLGYHRRSDSDFTNWTGYLANGVNDLPAFVNVAYIHNASYIGGLLGLIVAIFYLLGKRRLRAKVALSAK